MQDAIATPAAPPLAGRYLMKPDEYYARIGLQAEAVRVREKAPGSAMPKRIYLSPQTIVWDSVEVFAYLDRIVRDASRDSDANGGA